MNGPEFPGRVPVIWRGLETAPLVELAESARHKIAEATADQYPTVALFECEGRALATERDRVVAALRGLAAAWAEWQPSVGTPVDRCRADLLALAVEIEKGV